MDALLKAEHELVVNVLPGSAECLTDEHLPLGLVEFSNVYGAVGAEGGEVRALLRGEELYGGPEKLLVLVRWSPNPHLLIVAELAVGHVDGEKIWVEGGEEEGRRQDFEEVIIFLVLVLRESYK